MRDDKIGLLQAHIAEQQDVDVDSPRTPAPRAHPPAIALDSLRRAQQPARGAFPLDLEHLVQESWLVVHAPRLGLDHRALAQDASALLAQAPARGAEVAIAAPEIGSESEVGDRHLAMRSATAATRVIARTSCTRTTSTPRRIAAATVAAVPSTRSVTGRSSSLPMNDLRDVPIRMGWPSSASSGRRRITSQLWSAVLPNPMPGSTSTRSRATPAAMALSVAARRTRLISSMRSPAYSVPSWLCISTIAQPRRAARSASAGDRRCAQTSLRIVAPATTAASATSSL